MTQTVSLPSDTRIRLVVAYAENRTIGKDNTLPWRLRGDLMHFKAVTMGHPIIMGRKTWESLGRPLPGRKNIVITRNPNYQAEGATVVPSIEAALQASAPAPEVCIIGGAQIYSQALPLAHAISATEVHASVDGDAHFPALDASQWQEQSRLPQPEENGYRYDFVEYQRSPASAGHAA